MRKNEAVPVHKMDDGFSGVYVAPFGGAKPSRAAYESSAPHRHDFYYCVLLEKGRLEMEVDFQQIQLPEPSVYLSYPGQIHQVNAAHLQQGWYFAYEPTCIEETLRDILDQSLSEVLLVSLSPEQAARFSTLLQYLYVVQNEPTMLFHQHVLQQLATAFVYQVAAVYATAKQSHLSRHPARSVELTKSFKQLLRQHPTLLRGNIVFWDQLAL